jgi:hypothetical protein
LGTPRAHLFELRPVPLFPQPIQTLAFELEVQGAAILAPHPGQFAVDLAETLPALFQVRLLFDKGQGHLGQLQGQDAGEAVAEGQAVGRAVNVAGLLGELFGQPEGLLLAQPVLMAAGLPFGEVLFGDGAAVKLVRQRRCTEGWRLSQATMVWPDSPFSRRVPRWSRRSLERRAIFPVREVFIVF